MPTSDRRPRPPTGHGVPTPRPRQGGHDQPGWYPPPPPGPPQHHPSWTPPQYPSGREGDLIGPSSRSIRSHGRRKRRSPLAAVIVLLLGVVALGAGLRFLPGSPLSPGALAPAASPSPTPPPPPPPLPFRAAEITAAGVGTTGFLSWALMDQRSGEIVGSANLNATTTTMSMIKAWLAADYLRRVDDKEQKPLASGTRDLDLMIRDSDNLATDRVYGSVGRAASINRMITLCDLSDSRPAPSGKGFGYTAMSARDAVRMGVCIANGTAAGPRSTPQLLALMRTVREGDFGVREALPEQIQSQVAIKNGWDLWNEDKTYRTNCLAIGDTWVLAVMLRYPSSGSDARDLAHNSAVCQAVANQLRNPEFVAPTPLPTP